MNYKELSMSNGKLSSLNFELLFIYLSHINLNTYKLKIKLFSYDSVKNNLMEYKRFVFPFCLIQVTNFIYYKIMTECH